MFQAYWAQTLRSLHLISSNYQVPLSVVTMVRRKTWQKNREWKEKSWRLKQREVSKGSCEGLCSPWKLPCRERGTEPQFWCQLVWMNVMLLLKLSERVSHPGSHSLGLKWKKEETGEKSNVNWDSSLLCAGKWQYSTTELNSGWIRWKSGFQYSKNKMLCTAATPHFWFRLVIHFYLHVQIVINVT